LRLFAQKRVHKKGFDDSRLLEALAGCKQPTVWRHLLPELRERGRGVSRIFDGVDMGAVERIKQLTPDLRRQVKVRKLAQELRLRGDSCPFAKTGEKANPQIMTVL
jgi:hypothetical protein